MRIWTIAGCTALTLLACLPTEPCACPPALGVGTVFGQVTDAAGAPVPGTTVHVAAYRTACDGVENPLIDVEERATDSQGRYRYALRTIVPSEDGCVRVAVLSAEGDTLATDAAILRFIASYGSGALPDSVRIDLRVP